MVKEGRIAAAVCVCVCVRACVRVCVCVHCPLPAEYSRQELYRINENTATMIGEAEPIYCNVSSLSTYNTL